MSDNIEINISSNFDDKGVQAATRETKKLGQSIERAMPRGAMKSPIPAALAGDASKAEKRILALATAQANLQRSGGNAAAGIATLRNAIAQVDKTTIPALRAMTKLSDMENRLSNAKGPVVLPRTLDGLSGPALNAAKALGAVAVAMAGLNSAASAIKGVADYEQTLNAFRVTATATDAEMKSVADTAKALGADMDLPATSAAGAAEAMLELTRAGLSVQDSINAAKGALQLGAAGMIDGARAAEYTAAALNSFGLAGDKAGLVADQFAAGASASAVSVEDMANSVEQGAGLFASYQTRVVGGVQALTDFNTAVAILGNVGIKGGKAGTYIASAIERLANPTDKAKGVMKDLARNIGITGDIAYDANGKMRPFQEIMQNVALATKDMTQAQRDAAIGTIFLTEGSKAVVPILNAMNKANAEGVNGWDAMAASVQRSGAANELAGAQMQGLNGAVAGLQSQVETLATNAIEPFLPLMTEFVQGAAQLAGTLATKAGPAAAQMAKDIGDLANYIANNAVPAMQILVPLISGVVAGVAAYTTVTKIQTAVTLAQTLATNLQTEAYRKQVLASAVLIGTYAAIAAGVALTVAAFMKSNEIISKNTNLALGQNMAYNNAAVALQKYQNNVDQTDKRGQAFAGTVQAIQAELERETMLLERSEAGGSRAAEQVEQHRNRIAELNGVLGIATNNLNDYTSSQLEIIASSATATEAAAAQAQGISGMGEAAALTTERLDELLKGLEKTYQAGGEAVGAFVQTELGFYAQLEQGAATHTANMASLAAERANAGSDEERAAIDERIAAVQAGYDAELQAQAVAYANQQSAQQAHLGQMLTDYTLAQVELGNISRDQGLAILGEIREEFGAVATDSADTFLRMTQDIDDWAASGNTNADILGSNLNETQAQAVELQKKIDEATEKRVAEVLIETKGQTPEQVAARLLKIEREVRVDILINERRVTTSGRVGGEIGPTKAAGGGSFMTNGPAHLVVGDNPGGQELVTVTPISGKGRTTVGRNMIAMAGGGTLLAGSRVVPSTVSRSVADAQKTAESIEKIYRDSSQRLVEIQQDLAERIAEIDEQAAERQIEARRNLNEEIASTAADLRTEMETNDFEKFAKGTNQKDFAAREAEEQAFYDRLRGYQEQARQDALTGDAELAADVLKIREDQLRAQQDITEKYNSVRAEAGKKNQEALRKEYDQAIAAQEEATNTRIAIAQAESQQRQGEVENQKTEAVQGAQEQSQEVIAKMTEQTLAIKGMSETQADAVISGLESQAAALGIWRDAFGNATASVVSDAQAAANAIRAIPVPNAPSSATPAGTTAAAGGGSFLTRGRTTLVVGDNPGGVERVDVTPISGKGQTKVGSGMIALAGGGTVVSGPGAGGAKVEQGSITLNVAIERTGLTIQAMGSYTRQVEALASFIESVEKINSSIRTPQAPLDPAAVQQLAADTATVARVFAKNVVGGAELQANQMKGYLEISGIIVDAAQNIVDLKQKMAEPSVVITPEMAQRIAREAADVSRAFGASVIPSSKAVAENVKIFGENVGAAVSALTSILDLKRGLQDRAMYPVDPKLVGYLAQAARDVAVIVARELAPAAATGDEALDRTLQTVSGSVDAIIGIIDLKKGLQERAMYPVDPELIKWLARAAKDVLRVVQGEMLPTSEEQAKALDLWAGAVASSVSVIKDTLGLQAEMFTDYVSPSDQDLNRIAQDANRVASRLVDIAKTYDTKGLEGAQLFADAVGGTFSAFKDGLLFFDALNSGDFKLNTSALRQFESSTAATLEVAGRLGALAATIPPGNLAALSSATAALSGQAEALIKLAAVPWADLPSATRNYGATAGGGGAGGSMVNNFYISGTDPNAVANIVMQRINTTMQTRR